MYPGGRQGIPGMPGMHGGPGQMQEAYCNKTNQLLNNIKFITKNCFIIS